MPLGNWFKKAVFRLDGNINACVSNAQTAGEWYREKFGFKTRKRTDADIGDWDDVVDIVICKFADNEYEAGIFLMQLAPGKDDGYRTDGNDSIIDCTDINEAMELLASRGVLTSGVQEDGDGSRYFYVQDPDGNKLQILQRQG